MTCHPYSVLSLAALAGLSLVAAAPAATCAPAKRAALKPAAPRKIDPQAKALLTQMTAAYQALTSFSCTIDTKVAGGKSPIGAADHHILVRFKKPALVSVTTSDKSGTVVSQAVSDGKNMFMYQPTGTDKTYMEQAVPTSGKVISMALMSGAQGSFLMLLISAPEFLTPMLASASTTALALGALGTVDGVDTQTVVLTGGDAHSHGTLTFVIGQDDHLLRSLVLTEISPARGTSTTTETCSGVQVNPDLSADTFTFTPPAGAKKADAAAPLEDAPTYDPNLKVGASPIVFAAKDMTGKPVSLSQYAGKVVLLDFWATWCGPCVGEVPNVVANYKKFHAQGLEIVGISLDNAGDRAKLLSFTRQNHMAWRQVYDGGGWHSKTAQLYKVQAIPFSLLIGRDGKIAAVDPRGPALAPAVETALAAK